MPVGDFPTVFPTIMTCWLNRMVTSENGITHKRYGIFQYSVIFWLIMYFFLLIMSNIFWANTCIFCIFYIFKFTIYNTMLHVFCKCLHCLLFMERFVCNLHAYSAYLQYKEDTGRSKMRQEFWSFRGFRTK